MAGAGYKLFNTGDVLTAAQVNTYLMQQTVMVFADSSARTTALSGVLAEGMLSYLQDTNVVQVYNGSSWVGVGGSSPLTTKGDLYTYSTTDARLGVGTNGQYLQADSAAATGLKWATLSAWSPAYPLLSSASLTGATTITISVSSYDSYYVYWSGASSATASASFYLRINGDTGSNYYSFGVGYQGTAPTYSKEDVQSYYFLGRQGASAADAFHGTALIFGGKTTSLKTIQAVGVATGSTTNGSYASSGHYAASAAITSISLVSSAGNFDAGTLYVYGG